MALIISLTKHIYLDYTVNPFAIDLCASVKKRYKKNSCEVIHRRNIVHELFYRVQALLPLRVLLENTLRRCYKSCRYSKPVILGIIEIRPAVFIY